jgi:hypothetical protein
VPLWISICFFFAFKSIDSLNLKAKETVAYRPREKDIKIANRANDNILNREPKVRKQQPGRPEI